MVKGRLQARVAEARHVFGETRRHLPHAAGRALRGECLNAGGGIGWGKAGEKREEQQQQAHGEILKDIVDAWSVGVCSGIENSISRAF
jgi:hypothetical protein